MRVNLSGPEWEGMVENFTSTAWRWEQQPVYASDLETGYPQRWKAGDLTPPEGFIEFSTKVLAPIRDSGRSRTRVRVIDEPPTWFQEWADWAADWNRAGGEVIHRMSRSQAQALNLTGDPLVDWWLVDDRSVLLLRFTPDGELYQVDLDDDPDTITRCQRVRDTAMEVVSTLR